MKWNAFNEVSPAINKTGERIFPFDFWEWLRLSFISGFAARRGGSSFNYNGGGSGGGGSGGSSGTSVSFEEVKTQIREFIKDYWIFGALIFSIIFVLGTILSYIQSVFSFIFLDSLTKNDRFKRYNGFGLSLVLYIFVTIVLNLAFLAFLVFIGYSIYIAVTSNTNLSSEIVFGCVGAGVYVLLSFLLLFWFFKIFDLTEPFKRNNSKGVSLFLFKFVITIITILVIAGLAFPYVYSFMAGNPVIKTVGIPYIILSVLALVAFLLIRWVIFLFLYDFAVPYTYVKGTTVRFSLGQIWKNIKENPLEVFIYWLARLVLTLAVVIISGIIAILALIVFLIIGLLLFGIGFLLYTLMGLPLFFIVLAVIFGIILFIVFVVAVGMCVLPFTIFLRYFELLNFELLTGIKLFKNSKKIRKDGK